MRSAQIRKELEVLKSSHFLDGHFLQAKELVGKYCSLYHTERMLHDYQTCTKVKKLLRQGLFLCEVLRGLDHAEDVLMLNVTETPTEIQYNTIQRRETNSRVSELLEWKLE